MQLLATEEGDPNTVIIRALEEYVLRTHRRRLKRPGKCQKLVKVLSVPATEFHLSARRVTALRDQVLALLQTANWRAWKAGRPQDWAEETHQVAIEAVYLFPSTREIDERYVEKTLPVIRDQLAKAAGRLAWVLNRVLSGN